LKLGKSDQSFGPLCELCATSFGIEGESLVLDKNMFIEQMLPGVTQRKLTEEEMTEYRRPFLEPGLDLSATITVFKSLIPLEHVSTI
jgi:hypothetical protein